MATWFKKWSNFDSGRSLGEWLWWAVCRLFGFPGAAVIAWLTTYWDWYWSTFNLAGLAFAFLGASIVLPCGAILAAIARNMWSGAALRPLQNKTQDITSADVSNSDPGEIVDYVRSDNFRALCDVVSENYKDFDKRFFIASQNLGRLIDRVDGIDRMLKPHDRPSSILSRLGEPAEEAPKDRFDSLELKVKRDTDYNHGRIVGVQDILAKFQMDFFEFKKNHELFADYVRGMFLAERVLDSYNSLNSRIDILEDKLNEPWEKKHLYGDWNNWINDFASYKSQIQNICRFLKSKSEIDAADVLDTPGDRYRADHWPCSFGDLNDIQRHDYQTFRIIADNYSSCRPSVISALTNKIYANL